jgi:hypothetical protein
VLAALFIPFLVREPVPLRGSGTGPGMGNRPSPSTELGEERNELEEPGILGLVERK